MTAPVLIDLKGVDFTEGDRVVYSSVNGIRVGIVEWIKDTTYRGFQTYKVYINLDEHTSLTTEPGKMYAKKMGYEYNAAHFLRIPKLTDTHE